MLAIPRIRYKEVALDFIISDLEQELTKAKPNLLDTSSTSAEEDADTENSQVPINYTEKGIQG